MVKDLVSKAVKILKDKNFVEEGFFNLKGPTQVEKN